MKVIAYYHISIGLIFYSLGLILLYEGARSGVYDKLIDSDILIPFIGVIIALFSMLLGIAVLGMGFRDLSQGESDG
jgi:hypothetical protein